MGGLRPTLFLRRKIMALIANRATQNQEDLTMAEPKKAEPKKDRIRIMIPISNDIGGKEDVTVGVNGEVIVIKRGKSVSITKPYYESLRNAVVEKHFRGADGGNHVEHAPRYSISLLGG
jgi:hypothetical protein